MNNLRNVVFATLTIIIVSVFSHTAPASDMPKVRIGVLKFGTVNWALSVIKDKELDKAEGIDLEVVELANKDATNIALQGGAVNIIVTDWIWVSRQRAEGKNYTFAPYSLAVGSLMVRPDAGIETVADLAGKNLGVAGGPVDKSWLLLRAYTQKELGKDMADMLKPNFAAPPLLNQLMSNGELDAVLNFWHFSARLQAQGMQELIGVSDILPVLGVDGDVPLLGWVFREDWGNDNQAAVGGFLSAARKAAGLMQQDDQLWDEYLRPMSNAEDDATLNALRDSYRMGIPQQFGQDEIEVAAKVFEILAALGGEDLVGASTTLQPGTFWEGSRF